MEKIVLKFSAQHCFNVLSNLVEVTRCQARCYACTKIVVY